MPVIVYGCKARPRPAGNERSNMAAFVSRQRVAFRAYMCYNKENASGHWGIGRLCVRDHSLMHSGMAEKREILLLGGMPFMNLMKRLLALTVAAVLLLGCTACGEQASEAVATLEKSDQEEIRVAFSAVADAEQASWAGALWDTVEALCEEQGWIFDGLSAAGVPADQGDQIDQLLANEPDYFILFAGNSVMANAWVKKIYDAGVPVIMANIDAQADAQEYVSAFVGPDQEAMASQLAADMIWSNGADAGLNIVCISGFAAQQDYILREQGFEKTIGHFSNYTILGTEYAGASADTARSIMDSYIDIYGSSGIDVVMCYGDDFAPGVLESLEAAGILEDVQVYTISSANEIIQAVADGEVTETVLNDPALIAAQIGEVINGLMNGTIPVHYNYTELTYITSDNADEHIGKGVF